MNARHVFSVLGQLLGPFSLLLLVPALVDLGYGHRPEAAAFAGTAILTYLLGRLLVALRPADVGELLRVEAMAVVATAWLIAAGCGALPYLHAGFSPIDAYFESMSGFTTTGATIFSSADFERLTPGLLFWRAMTQWLGGMGIIVLFVAVLPALAVAGRRMFFAEAPGPEEEALTPRIRHTAMALWRLYIALTITEAILLATIGEMSVFDGVCHSFTTLAAGGFSPHGQSLAGYGARAQWIVTIFMFFAGASFALQYRALRRPSLLRRDTEFLTYAAILGFAGLLIAFLIADPQRGFEESLRHGLFQSASILTTTGFASEDFNYWPAGSLMVVATLMFIGGCAGSAGGGPKVIRVILLAKYLAREVLTALHPRAVKIVRIGDRIVPAETLRQIVGFFVAYITIFALIAVVTGILENDLTVGFTGSIATLGNIGPGFGPLGPMESYGPLGAATKAMFILAMWVGRLEVMTVLVLLHPDVLRSLLRPRG